MLELSHIFLTPDSSHWTLKKAIVLSEVEGEFMAIERPIMAEGTPGSGTEGARPAATLIIPSNRSGIRPGEYPIAPLTTEVESVKPSYFQQTLIYIEGLERQQQSLAPEQQRNLEIARKNRNELLREANGNGWFNPIKDSLMGIYYSSRVKVGLKEREGGEGYEGRGTLDKLTTLQEVVRKPSLVDQDRLGRISQIVRENNIFLGEEKVDFWSDPQRRGLEQKYRGIVDYFNRESLNTIAEVVKNRQAYTVNDRRRLASRDPDNPAYPDNGLYKLWKGVARDNTGHAIKDEEGTEIAVENFDDIRESVEEARRQEPWIPNRGDYETWIQFVAGDAEELEEMIPYIVAKVGRKLGTGEPQSVYQTLTQEKEKMDKAMAAFPTESEREFRRLKSVLTVNLNLLGAYIFSDLVRKDWQPFIHFADFLASSFQDTNYQDHFVDAALLDKDGMTMLALELYNQNDGEFWRYGTNRADIATKGDDIGALLRWQQHRKKQFEDFLVDHKLKSMGGDGGLLNKHPAFRRLKTKLDQLDAADKSAGVPLVDAKGNEKTRWQEYTEKALRWEQTGQFGDPRDRLQRVVFQHPLARVLRPKDFRDEQGDVTREDEFIAMFERDSRDDRGYVSAKRRKAKSTLEKAERISRAFVQDSAAALAWHFFPTPQALQEAQRYVYINSSAEAVAHKTLLRGMLHAAMREDRVKSPEHMRFKLHYLLTQKLGLDIDSPLFAAWYLGSHDTLRPGLLKYINQVPEFTQLLERYGDRRNRGSKLTDGRGDPTAMDEKTTIARWAEDERRLVIAMDYVLKRKFPKYFNFPGHDTPGAGVKDIRNAMLPAYGTSTDTVEINSLINEQWVGEGDYAKDYGCTRSPWRQLVGLFKGSDEVVFGQTGGFIENPRDTEAWVKRFNAIVDEYKMWTKGEKDSHGLLNDAPISGAYHLRARDRNVQNYDEENLQIALELASTNPDSAYKIMLENAYEGYVETAVKFISPLMAVMHHRLSSVDSTYGRNPGSAMFLNTLLWYGVSRWMDEHPEEFRKKFGFAYEADLSLSRIFTHTALYENRLIYSDQQWDEIMLGYVRIEERGQAKHIVRYEVDTQGKTKDDHGKWVQGEVHEGLIDAFPADLRKDIIKEKWLPFGINSYKPETLQVIKDYYAKEGSERTKTLYKKVFENANKLAEERKTVIRPV